MTDRIRATLARDFARNTEPLDRLTLLVFRWGQYARTRGVLQRLAWRLVDTVYLRLLVGAELPPTVTCGPGLRLCHQGRGVVVHPDTVIGEDVWIYHQVTIGARGPGRSPIIGDRVYVGTGAVIIGAVTVGDEASVGANAVVVRDVAPGTVATGVPAHRPPATSATATSRRTAA
jgi:serine O-acetyltransferase